MYTRESRVAGVNEPLVWVGVHGARAGSGGRFEVRRSHLTRVARPGVVAGLLAVLDAVRAAV